MKGDSALESILKDLTIALSEDNKLREVKLFNNDKKFGDAPSKDLIRINPEPAKMMGLEDEISEIDEFSFLISTESHELEHQVVSDLNSIRDFAEQYKARPKMAAMVMNAIEDTYVDYRRTNRDRGLRPVAAKFAEYWLKSQPDIYNVPSPKVYVTAVFQITRGNGTPKGFEKVEDEDFRNYCANVRQIIEQAKTTYIQKERMQLGHDIMTLIENEIGTMDVPEDMDLPSNMPAANDEELPEANEDNTQIVENPFDAPDNENEDNETKCPKCGCNKYSSEENEVDGMTLARCTPPFDIEAKWVKESTFIQHDDENGLCGFRVKTNGEIPKAEIENKGYKVENVSNSTEILEPKNRYDDTELVTEYRCKECSHEWMESR